VLGEFGSKKMIKIEGAPTYQPSGRLDMTTIEIFGGPGRRLSLPQVLSAWLSRSQAVLPQDEVFPPGQTAEEAESEDAALMSESQQSATAAGLREVGLKVPETVTISEVSPEAPAAKVLRAKDVITGVNGVPTADSAALRAAISALAPGSRRHPRGPARRHRRVPSARPPSARTVAPSSASASTPPSGSPSTSPSPPARSAARAPA
jgi:PDZ domain-containing protein